MNEVAKDGNTADVQRYVKKTGLTENQVKKWFENEQKLKKLA